MNVYVSIIIPVYNGEKDIQRCIKSIQDMTYKDVEILIIDDGSTDQTGMICEELARDDERIQVWHIPNQGQGKARNIGLNHAQGKYVFFVDGDDFVIKDGLENMLKKAQGQAYDVLTGIYYRDNGQQVELIGNQHTEGMVSRSGTKEERMRYEKIKTSSLFGYVWNKLYRKEFLKEHHLQVEDIREIYMEDTIFNLKIFSKNPKYFLTQIPLYHYNAVGTSTTRKAEPDIAKKNRGMIENYYTYLCQNGLLEENLDLIIPLAARSFCWSLIRNVEYEGVSFKKNCQRTLIFLESSQFTSLLKSKKAMRCLWGIPSILERIFYSFTFGMLRIGGYSLLCFIFVLANPIMKMYIKSTLK